MVEITIIDPIGKPRLYSVHSNVKDFLLFLEDQISVQRPTLLSINIRV